MMRIVVLLFVLTALFTPVRAHGQSQRILHEVKAAKAQNKNEITIATPRADYYAAGTLAEVVQKRPAAILLRTERVAPLAGWADLYQIVTWHTFTIESRLMTPPPQVADPAHDRAHGHQGCTDTRRSLGFDRLKLRPNELALYFPGGSLRIDGVVVHVSGWQRISPVANGSYLVFGELCDDARSISLAHGPEGLFQVSADGTITPVVKTPLTAEIARFGTVSNLRTRINSLK